MFVKDEFKPIAEGGLLDRRLFLKKGITFTGIAMLAPSAIAGDTGNEAMKTPGRALSNYGNPSGHEKKVIRWTMGNASAPGNGVSWTPLHALEGIITPSGLHFERHHNGVPDIDPKQHRLLIHGLVKRALVYTVEDLQLYPMTSRYGFIECGGNSNAGWHSEPMQTEAGYFHGMASCSEWTGVPVQMLIDEAGIKGRAKWVIAEGADASKMSISLPLEKLMDDCLLAFYQNGERIRPENGYPMRLLVPGWEGVLNVKWLRRLRLSNRPVMARNETAKYTELLPSGKAEQFSFVMGAKSLITSPSHGQQLKKPGLYQITGLAWSGHGRIESVDVSADGGKTWAEAELQGPVLSKCFTRFRIPWQWEGNKAVLKSRAIDEKNNVQPERTDLIDAKGQHAYFHYNAIVSWAVSEEGSISHVYT